MAKNQDIAMLLQNVGFAFEFFKAVAHKVIDRGGSMEHLRCVVSDGRLAEQIACLLVPDGVTKVVGKPLAKNECVVRVDYDITVNKDSMEALFSKDGVSPLFHGDYKWGNHPLCADVGKTSGDQVFRLEQFNCCITSKEAIAKMDALGYRPATHLELITWSKANPEAQLQFWIVALGSSALRDGLQDVAMLYSHGGRRFLYGSWFGRRWRSAYRFLFVRKA